MTDENMELTRRKILASVGAAGVAGAGAGFGTSALFNDRETFANDRLVAGELDLKVSWERHYAGRTDDAFDGVDIRYYEGDGTGRRPDLPAGYRGLPADDAWVVAVDDPARVLRNTARGAFPDADGDDLADSHPTDPDEGVTNPCEELADVGPGEMEVPVVDVEDAKPGDFGEVTLDFALCDNPGFVWLNGELRSAAERGVTEPEGDAPGEDGDPAATDPADVELLDAARAAVWVDDGNNYQNGDEVLAVSGSLRSVLAELRTGRGLALGGNADASDGLGRNCFSHDADDTGTADVHYVTFAWWIPRDVGNEIQSDSVTFDLGFYAEQCRNNGAEVDLDSVVTSPEMQQLLTDLGHPSPSDPGQEDFGSLGPVELRFDQARTQQSELETPVEDESGKEVSTIYTTIIPSPVGRLQVVSTGTDPLVSPAFFFDAETPEPLKNQLDLAGEVGWPAGTQAVAVPGAGGSSAFVRDVSGTERDEIADSIGREVGIALAFSGGGESMYATPPTLDQIDPDRLGTASSGPLVTDGGTVDRERTSATQVVDPTDTTFILGPGFGVHTSYTTDELVDSLSGAFADCLDAVVSCIESTLTQAAGFLVSALWACALTQEALEKAAEEGLGTVGKILSSTGILAAPARFFLTVCVLVWYAVFLLATPAYIISRCLAGPCFGSSGTPAPSIGEFVLTVTDSSGVVGSTTVVDALDSTQFGERIQFGTLGDFVGDGDRGLVDNVRLGDGTVIEDWSKRDLSDYTKTKDGGGRFSLRSGALEMRTGPNTTWYTSDDDLLSVSPGQTVEVDLQNVTDNSGTFAMRTLFGFGADPDGSGGVVVDLTNPGSRRTAGARIRTPNGNDRIDFVPDLGEFYTFSVEIRRP